MKMQSRQQNHWNIKRILHVHTLVYDEDACIRLGECKDIHADFALENVLIDILV